MCLPCGFVIRACRGGRRHPRRGGVLSVYSSCSRGITHYEYHGPRRSLYGPHEETAPLQGPSLVSGLVDGGMLPEGEPSHPNTLPGCLGRRLSRFSWAGTPVGVQAWGGSVSPRVCSNPEVCARPFHGWTPADLPDFLAVTMRLRLAGCLVVGVCLTCDG